MQATDRPADDRPRLPYAPGLDGLRGLAVAGVVVFHAGPASWLPGGFLGVSLFFTLSGYLIGSLVLAEVERTGAMSLTRFWSRRARRLLPALLLTVVLVVVLARTIDVAADTRRGLLGGLTYSANWVQLADGRSYAELFRAPSPVTHLWSLAIEEQFYVVFPLAAWAVVRARRGSDLRRVLAVGGGLVAAAGLAIAWLVDDAAFTYYATPTRAPEIAVGVLLAALSRATDPRPSRLATGIGVAGLVVTVLAWRTAALGDGSVGNGGLVAFAVASGAIVAGASRPGPLATVLGWRPLRALGVVSYGLYLFHWPVVVLLDRPRLDWAPVPLFAARSAVALALAVASYLLVERPVRAGWSLPLRLRLRLRLRRAAPSAGLAHASGALKAGLAALGIGVLLVLGTVPGPPAATESAVRRPAPALIQADDPVTTASSEPRREKGRPSTTPPEPETTLPVRPPTTPLPVAPPTSAAPPPPPTTQARPPPPPRVVLLGDSVPNWLVRDGAAALDPTRVALIDGTSEGCDGAEGAPVGRSGNGTVVSLPASCTGWTSQYPPVVEAGPVDVAGLVIGSGAVLDRLLDGEFRGPCDPVARRWYGSSVEDRLAYLRDHARRVVLVLPAWAEDWSGWVNPPDHRARTDCVRATLRSQADRFDDVAVVDLVGHLCPNGPAACRPVREKDGVHVDPAEAGGVLRWLVDRAIGRPAG